MADPESARSSNELSCLVALRDAGELTITELMAATGLSRPTADAIARVLEQSGAIGSTIRPARGAGRPARVYHFTADQLTVGLEIGLSTVRVIAADRAGAVVGRRQMPRREPTSEADLETSGPVLDDLEGAIDEVVGDRELAGIGLALPGIIADQRVSLSRVLPALNTLDIAAALEDRTGVPVRIGNDVKLAGLGEARVGAGRSAPSMLLVWLGRRVSTSVVMDGIVLQGAHGLAGEITAAVGTEWTQGSVYGAWTWPDGLGALETGQRAVDGDDSARAALEDYLGDIARPLARLTAMIDPHLVVISGVLSESPAPIAPMLSAALAERLTVPIVPEVAVADHGRYSSAIGALVAAYDDPAISGLARWVLPSPAEALRRAATAALPPVPSRGPENHREEQMAAAAEGPHHSSPEGGGRRCQP